MPDSEAPREAWVAIAPRRNRPAGAGYNVGAAALDAAMGRLIGAHPRIAPAFGALFAQVMFAPGHLSRAEREMIAAVAAGAQDCYY